MLSRLQDDSFLGLFRRYPSLLMLSIATAIIMMAQGITVPILPLYARTFDASAATVGLTISVFGIARMILNIPVGLASDRIGRRFVLVGGPLVVAISSVLSGLSGSLGELLVWRFVAGAGSAMYMTGAAVFLTDIAEPQTRARIMGVNQGSLLAGVSLGPVVGGFVAEIFDYRAAFFVIAGLSAVCAIWAFTAIPETRSKEHRKRDASLPKQSLGDGFRRSMSLMTNMPFFLISMVTLGTFFARSGGRQTIMPLLGKDRFDLSAGSLGLIFSLISVLNLVTVPMAGTLADRWGRKAVIVPSALVSALSFLMLAWAPNLWWLWVAAFVQGIGTGFAGPAPAAYAADIAPESGRGFAMGLYRTYGDLGLTVGPPLVGWIADSANYNAALYFSAALLVVTAIAFQLGAYETAGRKRQTETAASGV